jgi:hypothetical protein
MPRSSMTIRLLAAGEAIGPPLTMAIIHLAGG